MIIYVAVILACLFLLAAVFVWATRPNDAPGDQWIRTFRAGVFVVGDVIEIDGQYKRIVSVIDDGTLTLEDVEAELARAWRGR